jgi:hypothetical protein
MLWKMHQRLTYLNQLIKQKSTGTPKELAKKLCITERAWYKFKDKLVNDLKLPINYCSHSRSYVYTEEGSFEIGFRKLPKNESANMNGGRNPFLLSFKNFHSLNF